MNLPVVFVFTFPAAGHVNSILSVARELVKSKKCQVIIYSSTDCQAKVELAGAQFRSYDNDFSFFSTKFPIAPFRNQMSSTTLPILRHMQNFASKSVAGLIHDIERDKPVLVLYDQFALYAKWALRIMREHYQAKMKYKYLQITSNAPSEIMYYSFFSNCNGIYPNQIEKRFFGAFTLKARLSFARLYAMFKQFLFCWKYKMNYSNVINDLIFTPSEQLNLVFVSPYLQPRSHLFDKQRFYFVGSAIDKETHHDGQSNNQHEPIFRLMSVYAARNPIQDILTLQHDSKKLIYVSFGTLHNNNTDLALAIIKSFLSFNDCKAPSSYKLENLDIIVSLSKATINEIIETGINMPANIYLLDGVPQLEILKRASLFITHSGMNSISESIHYGVPVISIPLTSDQPRNSYRITTELGLGIELSFVNLKSERVREVVHELLNDTSYHKRMLVQAKLSREFIGKKLAAEAILTKIY